jgi:benzoyl-CoA reductase subunit B
VLPEINALQSAMRGKTAEYIALAEKLGHSEDVCTYVKSDIGMMKSGNIGPTGQRLPEPDILLLSYTGCFTFMKWFDAARSTTARPSSPDPLPGRRPLEPETGLRGARSAS